jgi:hypothetical protein
MRHPELLLLTWPFLQYPAGIIKRSRPETLRLLSLAPTMLDVCKRQLRSEAGGGRGRISLRETRPQHLAGGSYSPATGGL